MGVKKIPVGGNKKKRRRDEDEDDAPSEQLTLPTEASEPSESLGDCVILIHGKRKIGKTSLASKFGKTFVMATEVGYKGLRLQRRDVKTWADAKGYAKLLKKDRKFDTVCVDTADNLYNSCEKATCQKLVIKDLGDEEYGKGWRANRREFEGYLNELAGLGKGLILISHSKEQEIRKRNGDTYDQIDTTMPKQARETVEAMADIIAHYSYDGERRILTILGDDHVSAGHRFEERFRTPDGRRIRHIDMGRTAAEGYANFVAAFNNEYVPDNEDDLDTDEEEAPTPKKRKAKKIVLKRRR